MRKAGFIMKHRYLLVIKCSRSMTSIYNLYPHTSDSFNYVYISMRKYWLNVCQYCSLSYTIDTDEHNKNVWYGKNFFVAIEQNKLFDCYKLDVAFIIKDSIATYHTRRRLIFVTHNVTDTLYVTYNLFHSTFSKLRTLFG